MRHPSPPKPGRKSNNAGRLFLFAMVALALVGLGLGLGWLAFGRDQGASSQEPLQSAASVASATQTDLSVISPTVPPSTVAPTKQATAIATPVPPTPTQPPPSPTPLPTPAATSFLPPNWTDLQAQALDLINASRADAGLQPVAWDPAAAKLGQAHAEDMLAGQFFSHWNRDGFGPDHRAALVAGMADAVFENIHTYWLRFDDGTPAPIEDWPQRILDAQQGFMDSPGHRDNILDPAHTHVGIGIGYRPDTGELRLVQEFVNRYVDLDPLPAELSVGEQATITGRLLTNATDPQVNLAFEPFPQPMTPEQLNQTGSYRSAAGFFSAPRTRVDGQDFQAQAIFDANQAPGLYHVRVFVTVDGNQVLAASPIVVVRQKGPVFGDWTFLVDGKTRRSMSCV